MDKESKKKTLACSLVPNCQMNLVKEHEKKPDEYWDEQTVLTAKHRGVSVMMWGCLSAKGVALMIFVDGTMNTCGYTKYCDTACSEPDDGGLIRSAGINSSNMYVG
uniref:Uncharacterized protein n=1 Tax=Stegastes partitus TaxID=144197 RepID=A0A3B5A7E3_9TELE